MGRNESGGYGGGWVGKYEPNRLGCVCVGDMMIPNPPPPFIIPAVMSMNRKRFRVFGLWMGLLSINHCFLFALSIELVFKST